jgi:hypothetical protein
MGINHNIVYPIVMRQLKKRHRETDRLHINTFNCDTFFVWDRKFEDNRKVKCYA